MTRLSARKRTHEPENNFGQLPVGVCHVLHKRGQGHKKGAADHAANEQGKKTRLWVEHGKKQGKAHAQRAANKGQHLSGRQ